MPAVELRVLRTDLARILENAILFNPKGEQFDAIRVRYVAGRLTAQASDSYTMGRDSAPASANVETYDVWLRNDEALELAKRAKTKTKKTKRSTDSKMSNTDDSILIRPIKYNKTTRWQFLDATTFVSKAVPTEGQKALHVRLDELMCVVHEQRDALPEHLAFNTAYLARLNRVRTGTGWSAVHMHIFDSARPVLVQVGPTFEGLVMPVQPPEGFQEMME